LFHREAFMKKLCLAFCLAYATSAYADWPTDAGVDVTVANVGSCVYPSVVGDGKLGAFVIFERADTTHAPAPVTLTLRGEHFDATANRLWGTADVDGGYSGKDLLGLTIGTNYTGKPQAVTDGVGGLIAGYAPESSGGTFTLDFQRFDKDANPQWATSGMYGGVQLLANPSDNKRFWAVSDQQGGVLTTYEVANFGAYGQRLDPTGATKYGSGVPFANQQYPGDFYPARYLDADGQGGMYYIWTTSGSSTQSPALGHADPSGTLTFTDYSFTPGQASFGQWSIAGIPDGGGAWTTWQSGSKIYVQFVLPDGGTAFDGGPSGGLLVASPSSYTPAPLLVHDGTGGAILAWLDVTAGVNVLYAQRYGPDGSPLWGAQPLLVSSAATPPSQYAGLLTYQLVPTADNNVALFWIGTPSGIYAEKLAIDGGAKLWGPTTGGVTLSNVTGVAWLDAKFVEDDSAYLAYQDQANQILIKHVRSDGTLGPPIPDAGLDAGAEDGGGDGGQDAGPDAGPTGTDGGVDAGPDAGPTGTDGGVDAGPTGTDGGGDAGVDAGSGEDAGDGGTSKGGCGCGNTGPDPIWLVGLGSILLLALRRRDPRVAPE
jgi:hypothetical protein